MADDRMMERSIKVSRDFFRTIAKLFLDLKRQKQQLSIIMFFDKAEKRSLVIIINVKTIVINYIL